MIEVNKISKSFKIVRALRNVSMEVDRGEIMGLVGPDGAGKTTLLRIVCGIVDQDEGVVLFNGQDIRKIGNEEGMLGYMPQRFSLYQDLTIMENIYFFASMYRIKKSVVKHRAIENLEHMGIAQFGDRLAGNLSGGMKQKLALTCALTSRPDILVLDEPTYGVDPESRQEFWKILYDLNQQGLTILVSTPYMDEAELCTRVAVMHEGQIVATGKPAQLRDDLAFTLLEVRVASKDPDLFIHCPGIITATFYGDKYHLAVCDLQTAEPVIKAYLDEKGVPIQAMRPVDPSMEDVYVAMVNRPVEAV